MNEEKITTSANKKLSPEEIKRVKGLGCLQDKRYDDIFNIRVITGNGHITTDEHRAIADAADKFGNGQITMTTRLSMEIQGVPYDNIEKTIAFLGEHGLMTGGTGAKVRPVVSCKGTTCQYGLIDTFALSKKIHERFYVGYHDVILPHKFKIAGCPNNCVKPNLNDMGIIGQRIPKPDAEKCRGCKKCQIEKSCPVHVPKLVDGKLYIDPEECIHCGRCKGKCPFGAVAKHDKEVYKIFVGGTWGKKTRMGTALSRFVEKEEIFPLLEKTMLWFKENAYQKERLGAAIDRIGVDKMEEALFGDDLLNRKEEILAAPVKERA